MNRPQVPDDGQKRSHIVLVRHSLPAIDPSLPPHHWPLSAEGRRRCGPLADRLKPFLPEIVVTSVEPKAVETGQLIGARLGVPSTTAPGLHEHDRSNLPWLDVESFHQLVRQFFDQPDDLVMGSETAVQASRRFGNAISGILSQAPSKNVVVVAHGTVISLFVASITALDPFRFWQDLDLPDAVVLERRDSSLRLVSRENSQSGDASDD